MGRKSIHLIPTASAGKIIEKAGAVRVSAKGAEMLAEVLQDIGVEISKHAIELAEHAGRKTVKASDVKLAMKRHK